MTRHVPIVLVVALSASVNAAQESKPVPKDSIRVSIPGCTKGSVFTTVRPTTDQPGNIDVAAGTHMHMNGKKELMADIKKHQGQLIELTGIVKRGDLVQEGIAVGKGVRISPGTQPSTGGGGAGVQIAQQIQIDVESWRQIPGDCPRR